MSAAQDLLLQKSQEQIDVMIISEYYRYERNINEAHGWYCDKSCRAAIVNCNNTQSREDNAENGFTWITIQNLRIYTCYISSNTTLIEYENWLARLEMSIITATCDVIVAGDFNAKHRIWNSRVNDDKGESLAEFTHALGLIVCNQGDRPTWQQENSESFIDVTMVSANLAARVTNWQVLEEYSHSDHNYIAFTIEQWWPTFFLQGP